MLLLSPSSLFEKKTITATERERNEDLRLALRGSGQVQASTTERQNFGFCVLLGLSEML
jgi:hypothetical protein